MRSLRFALKPLVSSLALMLSFAACSGGKSGSTVDQAFLGGVLLDLGRSSITVGSSAILSGSNTIFTLTTRDQGGAVFLSPTPLTVVFNISGGTSTGIISGVTDQHDGTYTAMFTGGTAGTTVNVSATINGASLTHTPATVQVTGGVTPVAGNSSIVGSSPVVANGVAASTVTITLKDASNIAVAGVVPTFTATDTGATNAYGVCPATDAAGVSTCTLKSTKAETKTLSLATPIVFAGGNVVFQSGPASQIVYTTQPSASTVSGVAFATQPILAIEDANGNVVTSGADATATVSLAITTGSGTLGGTVSMSAVAGVANFVGKGLNIDLTGTNKVLTATKADTTGGGGTTAKTATTAAFTITHGAASQIVYSTQPSASTVSSVAFAQQPILTIKDAAGNVVTSGADATATVTLTLTTGLGTLGGTTNMSAVAGVADFAGKGLNIDIVGVNKVLTATKADTTGGGGTTAKTATTAAFTITYGAASQLAFTTQPAGAVTGIAFTTQPVVTIEDAAGNAVTGGADATRTVALTLTTGGGTLSGTASVAAVAGVATFAGLNINLQGAADVLTATATITAGLRTTTSAAFAVALGTPFTQDYPFTALTNATYSFSNSATTDLTGGILELTPTSQTDNTSTLFNNGTYTGTAWDGGSSVVRLDQTGTPTNKSALDSSWAPKWANIVQYWKLDGTVGAITTGTNIPATVGNNGTASNVNTTGMAYAAGKIGQGVNFDGTDDTITSNNALPLTATATISFWLKETAFSSAVPVMISGSSAGAYAWQIYTNGTYNTGLPQYAIGVGFTATGAWTVGGTYGVSDLGAWHHIVVTYDKNAAPKIKIYKDSVLQAMTADTTTGDFPTHDKVTMGIRADGSLCCTTNGVVDEMAIWNTVLSQTEIATIYSRQSAKYSGTFTSRTMDALSSQSWTSISPVSTLPFNKELPDAGSSETTGNYSSLANSTLMNGIAGLWHFDEAAGTSGAGSVKDQSGQSNNGTPNSVTFGVAGRLGTAASLTAGAISVSDAASLKPTNLTISTWVNPTSITLANFPSILMKTSTSSWIDGYGISSDGSTANKVFFWVNAWNNASKVGVTLPLSTWSHIVGTYDGSTTKIYLNGTLVTSASYSTAITHSTNTLFIGGGTSGTNTYSYPWAGSIDELAIWSRALSATEILQLYRRGANRILYQARTCTATNCTDDPTGANWKGPDGTNLTYFSELFNMATQSATPSGNVLAGLPMMTFANFTSPPGANQYFQYRAIMESDDTSTNCNYGAGTWCSPELKSVSVAPIHYDTSIPTVSNAAGVSYHYLTSLSETLGSTNGCVGGAKYILSPDGATWYWYTAGAWAVSDSTYAKANSAATFTGAVLNAFAAQAGTGNLYFKAFLKSNGTQACEIDDLTIGGNQ